MKHIDLFSGIGGFAYAFKEVFGNEGETVLFCDNDRYCQKVLRKHWPKVPIWGDIRELIDSYSKGGGLEESGLQQGSAVGKDGQFIADTRCQRQEEHEIEAAGTEQRGGAVADTKSGRRRQKSEIQGGRNSIGTFSILTGGFPCQPFSHAGKRRSTSDNRYLWPEMLEVIRLTKPTWVIAENVYGILSIEQGVVFEQVCLDLEEEGYEVRAFIIPACAVNAPHRRDRVWFVAKSKRAGAGSKNEETHNEKWKTSKNRGKSIRQGNGKARPSGTKPAVGDDTNPPSVGCDNGTDNRERRQIQGSQIGSIKEDKQAGDRWLNRVSKTGDDAPIPASKGLERKINQEGQGSRFNRKDWQADWREVAFATCVRRIPNGFALWLHFFIKEGGLNDRAKEITRQDLRTLQETFQSEKVREAFGRCFKIPDTEVLLETLCQLSEGIEKPEGLPSEDCSEYEKEILRGMRNDFKVGSSSQKRDSIRQQKREYQDIMLKLSYETALEIAEAWHCVRRASEILGNDKGWVDGKEVSEAKHRTERLKMLGNSIVPQVVMEIMKTIKETCP